MPRRMAILIGQPRTPVGRVGTARLRLAVVVTAVVVLTACGSGGSGQAATTAPTPTTAPAATTAPTPTTAPAAATAPTPTTAPAAATAPTPTTAPLPTTALSPTTAPAATGGVATCPTLAQADAALGGSYGGPLQTPVGTVAVGIVCEYTGRSAAGNAGVTIFAHQAPAVFAGQVANAGRAPGMARIAGVGDGAFGLAAGGRTIVNAWSNVSRTVVAAQSSGSLAQTEALARVALADNN